MESKNKLTRPDMPAYRQRMLEVERTRKVTVSKHHTMTALWILRHHMDENGRLRLSGLQETVRSCGTHATKSEFSQNAPKVKGFSFLVKNLIDFYKTAFYIKMHIYEKKIITGDLHPK